MARSLSAHRLVALTLVVCVLLIGVVVGAITGFDSPASDTMGAITFYFLMLYLAVVIFDLLTWMVRRALKRKSPGENTPNEL